MQGHRGECRDLQKMPFFPPNAKTKTHSWCVLRQQTIFCASSTFKRYTNAFSAHAHSFLSNACMVTSSIFTDGFLFVSVKRH